MAQVARLVSRKRGTVVDANEDEGQHQWVVDNATLQSVIANGEDLGPIVRPAFEQKKPEALVYQVPHHFSFFFLIPYSLLSRHISCHSSDF